MGVLACNRYGCENIMCDRYSSEYGYICNDCFDELVSLGSDMNIDLFMSLPKSNEPTAEADPFSYYDKIFRTCYENK